ncbi:MAG: hypothetical protein ACI4U0_03955 [Candidatus Aphodocola sp.]
MKKIYCIIKNLNGDILTINNNGKLLLPNFIINNENHESYLVSILKNEFGLKIKREYLILKEEIDSNLYYLCEEPFSNKEFNIDDKKKESIYWIPVSNLKEVLPKEDKITYDALSNILHSKFSFSQKERNEMEKQINDAKEKNDILTYSYLLEEMFCLMTNDLKRLEESKDYYSKEFFKQICYDLKLMCEKEANTISLNDMTYSEAKIAGKEIEWESKFYRIYNMVDRSLPPVPARKLDYLKEAYKLEDKDGLTINILVDLYNRYKDSSYEEIREDMLARRKTKKNKKK